LGYEFLGRPQRVKFWRCHEIKSPKFAALNFFIVGLAFLAVYLTEKTFTSTTILLNQDTKRAIYSELKLKRRDEIILVKIDNTI
jgi:hypothetical protein